MWTEGVYCTSSRITVQYVLCRPPLQNNQSHRQLSTRLALAVWLSHTYTYTYYCSISVTFVNVLAESVLCGCVVVVVISHQLFQRVNSSDIASLGAPGI
jgi:hypothetical protein